MQNGQYASVAEENDTKKEGQKQKIGTNTYAFMAFAQKRRSSEKIESRKNPEASTRWMIHTFDGRRKIKNSEKKESRKKIPQANMYR